MAEGFLKEIDGESAEKTPVIHGLLKVIAHLFSVKRGEMGVVDLNAQDDWNLARSVLTSSVSRIGLGSMDALKEKTFENYYRQEIGFKALEIYRRTGREDPVVNWHEAVNFYASRDFNILNVYLIRRKKAA